MTRYPKLEEINLNFLVELKNLVINCEENGWHITFSKGVYCGWWWGMTGLLALVLYATKKAHLLKSLLLGPLVCNKLL